LIFSELIPLNHLQTIPCHSTIKTAGFFQRNVSFIRNRHYPCWTSWRMRGKRQLWNCPGLLMRESLTRCSILAMLVLTVWTNPLMRTQQFIVKLAGASPVKFWHWSANVGIFIATYQEGRTGKKGRLKVASQ
jgi:hypothetical protein